MRDDLLSIGEFARRAGRRASSIRYYEEIGLLPEPPRRGGQRRYGQDAVRRLAVIDAAQRAGLTLSQIKSLLDAAATGNGPAANGAKRAGDATAGTSAAGDGTAGDNAAISLLRAIAAANLTELIAHMEQAEQRKRWLEAAASCECASLDDCALFSEAC